MSRLPKPPRTGPYPLFLHPSSLQHAETFSRRPRANFCCTHQTAHGASQNVTIKSSSKARLPPPDASAIPITSVSDGQSFIATVLSVGPANSAWLDINVCTPSRRRQVHGQLRLTPSVKNRAVVGAVLPVSAWRVQRESGRIEVRLVDASKESNINGTMLEDLDLGMELNGTIVGLGTYGAVLDVGVVRKARKGRKVKMTALMPRDLFPEDWGSETDLVRRGKVQKVLNLGDKITVWVVNVGVDNARILVGGEKVTKEDLQERLNEWKRRNRKRTRRKKIETLVVGEQKRGVVRRRQKYGAFVDIGVRRDGLLHYSKMGQWRWGWEEKVAEEGKEVVVTILGVEDGRIELELVGVDGEFADQEEEVPLWMRDDNATDQEADLDGTDKNNNEESPVTSQMPGIPASENELQADEYNDGDDDDEEEEVEKFSDEYFEDKYGL